MKFNVAIASLASIINIARANNDTPKLRGDKAQKVTLDQFHEQLMAAAAEKAAVKHQQLQDASNLAHLAFGNVRDLFHNHRITFPEKQMKEEEEIPEVEITMPGRGGVTMTKQLSFEPVLLRDFLPKDKQWFDFHPEIDFGRDGKFKKVLNGLGESILLVPGAFADAHKTMFEEAWVPFVDKMEDLHEEPLAKARRLDSWFPTKTKDMTLAEWMNQWHDAMATAATAGHEVAQEKWDDVTNLAHLSMGNIRDLFHQHDGKLIFPTHAPEVDVPEVQITMPGRGGITMTKQISLEPVLLKDLKPEWNLFGKLPSFNKDKDTMAFKGVIDGIGESLLLIPGAVADAHKVLYDEAWVPFVDRMEGLHATEVPEAPQ